MSKRPARDKDDTSRMPPPSTSKSTERPVLYYPEDEGHPEGLCLAPPSSPPPRQSSVASSSRRPVFGRFSSTGPKRRSALDNIGYAPEDIPTPRTTRPFSTATGGGTRKRQRGLRISAVATTSPVRPSSTQPAPSPTRHGTPSKRSNDGDDYDYVVDSSDDERLVRFNLLPEDPPRSSKVARASTSHTSAHLEAGPSSRPSATPSTKRRSVGTTPARRSNLAVQLGVTPARADNTSTRPGSTGLQISSPPIPLNLPQSRPVFRPSLAESEASPFVSTPYRARVISQKPQPAAGPSRISELKAANTPSSSSGAKRASSSTGVSRAFSAAGAKNASSLTGTNRPPSPSIGTKRAPGSKSTSPGAKRPRVATPSPPAADDIIIVSSSDDDEEVDSGGPEEERRPSPSLSLGDFRPTLAASVRSRTGSGSASSDVVLIEPPPKKTTGPESSRRDSEASLVRDPPREVLPAAKAPIRASTPVGPPRLDPPSTPSPSRHSSSSEKQAKVTKRPLAQRVECIDSPSIEPVIGRRVGTGRRQRLRQETQNAEAGPSTLPQREESRRSSPKHVEASTSGPSVASASEPEQPRPRPVKPPPARRMGDMPPPRAPSAPSQRMDSPSRTSRSPSPPWDGKPLFRPPTTTASGLTPFRELSPSGTSVRPTPGPSNPRTIEPSKPPNAEPSKSSATEKAKSLEAKRVEIFGDDDDDDPLSSLYDEPTKTTAATIFGAPQYLVLPREPSAGPSVIFSYSHISSVPPPTILGSISPVQPPRRLDCVLLPRASKAVRKALERAERAKKPKPQASTTDKKGKGKANDDSPSEYASPQSDSESSSTPQPQPPPQPVKTLVIDPQLAESSHYPSLPPEIVESPEKYCHCCRTRSGAGKLKMRCWSMTDRRRRGMRGTHECGTYWCQRCIAKHDIPFNPTLEDFKCPLCTGTCECDVCRRDRGQEPLGRGAIKVVVVKSRKRTLDAFKGRVASRSVSSNVTTDSGSIAGPFAQPSRPTSAAAEPPADSTLGSSSADLESESSNTPPAQPPTPRRASAPGPTTWHGRRTPPPLLRLRLASGNQVLSSSTHIFIKRGPRRDDSTAESTLDQSVDSTLDQSADSTPDQATDSTPDPADDSIDTPARAESVHEGELSVEEPAEEGPAWGDLHQTFEGDYSAAGDASFLGADSGAFELEIGHEHGPEDMGAGDLGMDEGDLDVGTGADDTGAVSGAESLGVEVGPVEVGSRADGGTGDLGVVSDTVHSTTEGEGETSVASTVTGDTSRDSTEAPLECPLAYPPSDSSDGSQSGTPIEVPIVPVEGPPYTITGTLDDHPPIEVLVDTPAASTPDNASVEISHDTLTRIFNESVQGFAEGEAASTERNDGSTGSSQQSSEVDELQSTPEAPEPQPTTPDLDEIRAAFGLGDTSNPELTADIGQLHPEGTYETVPGISMGDGGDLTLHGSLRDISLLSAVMDCSDETCAIALSSSQTERTLTVCGSLSNQPSAIPTQYSLDIERLAIPELEDSESEPEHEPDLVHATDPESTKSTILETPSPQFGSDAGPNLAGLRNLFDTSSNHEPEATPFILPTEAKRARMRKLLQSQFAQQPKPATRTTRSQTRKSVVERSKLLRSKRYYGTSPCGH